MAVIVSISAVVSGQLVDIACLVGVARWALLDGDEIQHLQPIAVESDDVKEA